MSTSAPTVVESIERTLVIAILQGGYPAGVRLPPVRELAQLYGVNASTIQRVVARLEVRGLVVARQGSGLRVQDPERADDLGLLPFWIQADFAHPRRAAHRLEDLLGARRIYTARLVTQDPMRLSGAAVVMAEAGAQARRVVGDRAKFQVADMQFARVVAEATQSPLAMVLVNAIERVVQTVPYVAESMYADPAVNLGAAMSLVAAVRASDPELGGRVERELAALDQRTVARFFRRVAGGATDR